MVKTGIIIYYNVFVLKELDGMAKCVWTVVEGRFGVYKMDVHALMDISSKALAVKSQIKELAKVSQMLIGVIA